ncbi:monocarboxylate transporter 14 isoform X2 [Acyrthosiphon pisum]|uniref:Major facilitator superfamily (MFS) profile domain-containing protein n=1 Tax=Acyrthosiphon pisum TaxID=7029 RepID=A0A8R1W1R9_ACYPI|nr:monocarboxylate transporter 14 isoform X2 [Acyrthosiphon pisum]|eukprot:XP_001945535.1 PREDICTED: monocarboxylate transporter 14 isoform X2 [Acyrthosiphon pisum]
MEADDDGRDPAAVAKTETEAAATTTTGNDDDDDDCGSPGSGEEYDDYLDEFLKKLCRERVTASDQPCTVKRVSVQVESVPYGGVRYGGLDAVDDNEADDDDDGASTATITRKPKIPDGGWGWMVVFASLMICLISDGISFSFGLLYIEFLKEFQESKSKTAWIGSLFMAVPLILGPVGSALVDKFGCRKMTILGGVISGLGFIISSFADSIEMVFFTFGFLSGLGLCLCYVTAVVSIAYWFDKKRTLATGLGACGTGIGTLLYAPMTQYSIEEYGWRGTVLLLAGTFFNFCVCGALMRDPDWLIAEQKKPAVTGGHSGAVTTKPWTDTEESIVDHCPVVGVENETVTASTGRTKGIDLIASEPDVDALMQYPGVEQYRRMVKEAQCAEYKLTGVTTTVRSPMTDGVRRLPDDNTCFRSVINLPTYLKHNEKVPFEVLESLSSNKTLFNLILENYPNLLLCRSSSVSQVNNASVGKDLSDTRTVYNKDNALRSDSPPLVMKMKLKQSKKSNSMGSGVISPLESQAISPPQTYTADNSPERHPKAHHSMLKRQFSTTQSSYLKSLPYHRSSVMYKGAILNIQKNSMKASSCPDIYNNNSTLTVTSEPDSEWYTEVKELFSGILDFSMFLELHFLFLSLSTILLFTWFIVPYFYLTDFVMAQGLSETDASTIISTIGATNTVGMILLGWAGDYPWMNVTKVYAICLVGCGICCAIMPLFISSFWSLIVIGAAFGLFFASNFSFTPAILVELIPLDRFTTAYGLMLLCQGIGNLLGPPLAGWVSDLTGFWDLSFYLAGFWIVLSGVFIGLIPFTKNRLLWGAGQLEIERDSVRS